MNLNFKKFGEGPALIILHGLMGSLDNWQTIAKKFSNHFTVYILDQRNHGRSFHSNEFNYELLVQDLSNFFSQEKIERANIIGHSMGGKVAMNFALKFPEKIIRLIVVDIAPSVYEDRHGAVFKALFSINLEQLEDRKEAELKLRKEIEEESTIQFLMKNLYRTETNHFAWRFNLKSLYENYDLISEAVVGKPFTGKALFIKGKNSNYINAANFSDILEFFPQNEIEEIPNAGHWVHAEQPALFEELAIKFLTENNKY